MPSKSAKADGSFPRHVVIVLFDGAKLLDIAGPMQVFNDARDGEGHRGYRVTLASASGGSIMTDTGVALATEHLASLVPGMIDTLLIAGGARAREAAKAPALRAWLSTHATAPRRIGSICYGAFILAEMGLLDGRAATTHWDVCDRLALDYPAVSVTADAIYVVEDRIWTSAGVSAGIDMALAMVERDLGHPAALALARDLVLFLKRPGGQSQFSAELKRQIHDKKGRFDALHDWIRTNLDRDLSVPALAERAGMSPRNFARVYPHETGQSPARAIAEFRLDEARRMLETTSHSIQRIAHMAGFGDDERLRRAFVRTLGLAPQDYRSRFGRSPIRTGEI